MPPVSPRPNPTPDKMQKQRDMVADIKAQANQQVQDQIAENIISMGEGTKASVELEQKRQQAIAAFKIVSHQFNVTAELLEAEASLKATPLQKRHQSMDLARCMRTCQSWLMGALQDAEKTASEAACAE